VASSSRHALVRGCRARKNVFVVKVTFVPAVICVAALAACGGGESPIAGGSMTRGSTEPGASTGTQEASCAAGLTMVSGQANIFGAGIDFAPGPGGEGGGVLPPSVQLPERSSVVTISTITGKVSPMTALVGYSGAGGDKQGATDIASYGGISGIVDRRNGMFLVGVFLTDEPPSASAPKRLDFTNRERFRTLAPDVGQTFFIGDGGGRTFRVPSGATRVFLGFADAYSDGHFYQGHPGFYNNNGGHLCVRVTAASE
jgi:hypothetical protein